MAPTVGYANNATATNKSKIGPPLLGTEGLKKSSNTADATRATQSAHTDQAIHAAVRRFIPSTLFPCCALCHNLTLGHDRRLNAMAAVTGTVYSSLTHYLAPITAEGDESAMNLDRLIHE